MSWKREWRRGIRDGLPIGLGYIPVSFTFGFLAVSGGLPVWIACLISLTNLTSAGQFAGTNLILANAGYMEIAMTTFVINIRYMLMSLSLSQRIEKKMGAARRMLFGFGVTDETFVVASLRPGTLRFAYLIGLITLPIAGWNLGTLMGACISSVLPAALQNAMGIALYGMFIALLVPAARDSVHVLVIVLLAVFVNCFLKYTPIFLCISSGFRIILATVLGAGVGAALFPAPMEEPAVAEKEEK
ncbi:MAG: AzlC family ABC transporter permease [Lachnospiraceae bacterium]|jgi:predicted branched-subunit amino acid permease|nr:AzlC family ABC transporter permease [Lachnospiraceae bacterium]